MLLDFPHGEARLLGHWAGWASDVHAALNPARAQERLRILWDCAGHFLRMRGQRECAEPAGDLISMLTHSEAMRSMTPQEYFGNLILLLVGGSDTTRNSMGALPIIAAHWPEERAKQRCGWSSIIWQATAW